MFKVIQKYWVQKPLYFLLWSSFIIRLVGVIFSKGYSMFDDHFLVVEPAQSWIEGVNCLGWLPHSTHHTPQGHGWIFPGFHYIIFVFLEYFHITDPQFKMFFIRFLLAAYSLLIVYYGYKITQELSPYEEDARKVGLLLSFLFFFPVFSVRSLVEMGTIPFVLASIYYLIKHEKFNKKFFIAGLLSGVSITIRFQSVLFPVGIGMVLLYRRQFIPFLLYLVGNLITLSAVHGTLDWYFWGYPFAEIKAYIDYNITHRNDYITLPWYNFLIVLAVFLIPPISIFLLIGFFQSWKRYTLLFLPAFLFLTFHSYFPNKQERFILPMIPFIIILGIILWNENIRLQKAPYWIIKYHNKIWIFFWIINSLSLLLLLPAYMKKTRVEAMYYLYQQPGEKRFLIENSFEEACGFMPMFYADEWDEKCEQFCVTASTDWSKLCQYFKDHPGKSPNYIIFMEDIQLKDRIANIKTCYPNIQLVHTVYPSYLDQFIRWLNPINKNYTAFIYKVQNPH